jgi:hypothetical protein
MFDRQQQGYITSYTLNFLLLQLRGKYSFQPIFVVTLAQLLSERWQDTSRHQDWSSPKWLSPESVENICLKKVN